MRKLQVLFTLLVLAAALPVHATTVRRMANEELTSQADVIVIGRALSAQSRWIGRDLVTVVTVEVSDTLKGEAGAQIEVALPGGIDSRRKFPISVNYPGAPTLEVNERAVLFLVDGSGASSYEIAGFSQGKFSIVEDAAGVARVSRDLTRVEVQDAKGLARGTRTFQPLAELVEEIRGHLRRGN
jgi:hypothetical protein